MGGLEISSHQVMKEEGLKNIMQYRLYKDTRI
jgi:hypothetical protein